MNFLECVANRTDAMDNCDYTGTSEESMEQLKMIFDSYDNQKRGFLERSSFSQLCRDECNLTDEQSSQLAEFFDPNNEGMITFGAFKRLAFLDDLKAADGDEYSHCDREDSLQDGFSVKGEGEITFSDHSLMASSASPLRALSPTDSGLDEGKNEERYECDDYGQSHNETTNSSDLNNNLYNSFSSPGADLETNLNSSLVNGRNSWSRTSIRRSSGGSKASLGSPYKKDISAAAVANASLHSAFLRRLSLSFSQEDQLDENPVAQQSQLVDCLSEKVQQLENSLSTVTEDLKVNQENYHKAKQENTALIQRVHFLEENIREIEIKSKKSVEEERRKVSQIIERKERESQIEIDRATSRIHELQAKLDVATESVVKFKNQNDSLQQKIAELTANHEESLRELEYARTDFSNNQETLRKERDGLLKENQISEEVIRELSKRLEQSVEQSEITNVQLANGDTTSWMVRPASHLKNVPVHYEALEKEIERLRFENRRLKEAHEEIEEEVIALKVGQGQRLLETTIPCDENNWAAETNNLATLSKEELIEQLTHQKDTNLHLKEYIGGVLSNIILTYPQVLEKKV